MVRTRHSGEGEVVESPKFMSLDNERERSKFKIHKRDRTFDGSQSRRAYEDDDEYNIFEDRVLDSRLRPRTGPRRAYNYLDADSSDDDQASIHRRHKAHIEIKGRHYSASTRRIKEEMLEERLQNKRHISPKDPSSQTDVSDVRSLRENRQSLENQSYNRRTRRSTEIVSLDKNEDVENNEKDPYTEDEEQKDLEDEDTENDDEKERDSEDDEQKDQEDSDNEECNNEFSDMYSRVKRKRVRIKRYMFDDEQQNMNNNQGENSDEEEDGAIRTSKRTLKKKTPEVVKSYSLREHKPRTDLYKAPVEERKIRKNTNSIFETTPTKKTGSQPYQSPAQRKKSRKRSAMHSSSSSTSSSSSESSDEKSFKKRKSKSMAKARSRMMPMNLSNSSPVVKDRIKSGASLADVEPMNIDKNITFDSIGGLGKHIRALKEMVVFPLLYDKVFKRFNVDPPRGVLFYGPPGTGKTLVARALANECSHGDKRVAFFMRKGADCLSKWVGESERQLRLLFDQAYKYRPSIIFFDEIDGLAPVRSSRQDQIHSSIVSTLLALMDGLDSRGEIVVIGATNRIDSLDPALRRPGRFDREFLFPLPNLEARNQILKIQTASWNPKLNDRFITELAVKCVGYCGADLKSLCTEAAMLALRRRYPQIYISNEALQLDESSINVCAKDFFNAISNIIPTSRRSVNTPGRPLSVQLLPLLESQLNKAMAQLCDSFPSCFMKMSSLDAAATGSQAQALADAGMVWEELASDEDEDAPSIFVTPVTKGSKSQSRKSFDYPHSSKQLSTYLNFTSFSTHQPTTFRPRLILAGNPGQGQTSYVAPAIIHNMEDLPVHVLDLPALYAVTAKTPEESCANVFHEAKRKCPSIIYMPYINQWWYVLGDTLRTTLLTLIQDLNPSTPLLLLATSEQSYSSLDSELKSLFSEMAGEVLVMSNPNVDERKNFFNDLLLQHSCKPPPQKKEAAKRMLEVLPKAAPVVPKELTKQEMKALEEKEELTLMELRIFLRDVLHKLGSDKKFTIFAKAVDIENAPDYYDVIESPMDLSAMMSKIDCHEYSTVRSFMDDIDLICCNALEYNPDRGPMDRVIRHRACALKDTAYAIIRTELDKEFEKMCVEIEESRKRRGAKSNTVPNFCRTKPVTQNAQSSSQPTIPSYLDNNRPVRSIPKPEGERFSRRVRGIHIDQTPSLEDVERVARTSHGSPSKDDKNDSYQTPSQTGIMSNGNDSMSQETSDNETDKNNHANDSKDSETRKLIKSKAQTDPLHKKTSRSKVKCVWCKPTRKSRKRNQERIISMKRKSLQNLRTKPSKEDEDNKSSQATPVHHPLNVDVDTNDDFDEVKSPVRKSSRLTSPQISVGGVTTRRQSMSPRVQETVETKSTEPSQEEKSNEESELDGIDGSQPEVVDQNGTEKTQCEATPCEKLPEELDTAGVSKLLEKTAESLKDVECQPDAKKTTVVKRLDLDFAPVDSGAGSSLDGNGDSRDSMDHKLEEVNAINPSHHIKDFSQNNKNVQSIHQKASKILSETSSKLVVPTEKLSILLNRLVMDSEGYSVERLEKIYSQLSQIIFKHRHVYDRCDMVTELETKVAEMTRQPPSVPSRR